MPEYLSPGVYVEEISGGVKPIEGVSTSTAGMAGVTERGPEPPRLITSWIDFQRCQLLKSDRQIPIAVGKVVVPIPPTADVTVGIVLDAHEGKHVVLEFSIEFPHGVFAAIGGRASPTATALKLRHGDTRRQHQGN